LVRHFSSGTMRMLRLPTARPLALRFPSNVGTSLTPVSFARLGFLESLPLRLGVGRPVSPHHFRFFLSWRKLSRLSHVPREPFRAFALLSDPGRISAPSLLRRFDSAPAVRTTKAPALIIISRLYHTAFAPLHTLRAAIADDYAMFASGWWLAFAGWGLSPHWVPVLCFRVCLSLYILFLTFWVFLTRPNLLSLILSSSRTSLNLSGSASWTPRELTISRNLNPTRLYTLNHQVESPVARTNLKS